MLDFKFFQVDEETKIAIKDLIYFEQKDIFDLDTLLCSAVSRVGIKQDLAEIALMLGSGFFQVERFNGRKVLINIDHLSMICIGEKTVSLYLSNQACIVISRIGAPDFLFNVL